MSFIKESIEVVRPASYSRAHLSGPRRARTSRCACSLRSCTDLSTTGAPARSVTAVTADSEASVSSSVDQKESSGATDVFTLATNSDVGQRSLHPHPLSTNVLRS
jgi:hypothetical protein